MILGSDLFGRDNELLLSRGQVLTGLEIDRIRKIGYQGIHVTDGFSDELLSDYGVGAYLKNNAVISLKDVFTQVQTEKISEKPMNKIKMAIHDIVDEIVADKNAIINMVDLRIYDEYTYYHSVNVAVLSTVLGYAMGYGKNALYKLALGAALHDIGKVFISRDILDKPGKLTPEEFEIIKKHSSAGSAYLREKWDIPSESHYAVLTHHERYDGTGYPGGIRDDKIPEFGRIAAVVDVYDALTTDRPYRKGMLPSDAVEYIMGGSGNMFDPRVVKVFLREVTPYPIGTNVLLSNGEKGVVVENHAKCGTRPKVMISKEDQPAAYYDLYNDMRLLNITIRGIG